MSGSRLRGRVVGDEDKHLRLRHRVNVVKEDVLYRTVAHTTIRPCPFSIENVMLFSDVKLCVFASKHTVRSRRGHKTWSSKMVEPHYLISLGGYNGCLSHTFHLTCRPCSRSRFKLLQLSQKLTNVSNGIISTIPVPQKVALERSRADTPLLKLERERAGQWGRGFRIEQAEQPRNLVARREVHLHPEVDPPRRQQGWAQPLDVIGRHHKQPAAPSRDSIQHVE